MQSFLENYLLDNQPLGQLHEILDEWEQAERDFLSRYAGASFSNGLYKLHNLDEIEHWNAVISKPYSGTTKGLLCFGYDWMGRQLALSKFEPNTIFLYDIDTFKIRRCRAGFEEFHNNVLVEFMDGQLDKVGLDSWLKETSQPVGMKQCVGFKVPLFLGGVDENSNKEVIDLEVYWKVTGDLAAKNFT